MHVRWSGCELPDIQGPGCNAQRGKVRHATPEVRGEISCLQVNSAVLIPEG